MKIATTNLNGQVVIPAEFRKILNINNNTYLKIYLDNDVICIKPIDDNMNGNSNGGVVNFKKNNSIKPFHYSDKKKKNLSDNIDNIIYK